MSQPEIAETVLMDQMDAQLLELRFAAKGRFLNAERLTDMGPDSMEAGAASRSRQADFILEEDGLSHFVATRADSHGLQAAMLSFTGRDFPGSVPPMPEVIRQSEQALAGKLGSLTCVDFFSIQMGDSPLLLVGAETLAGGDRIEDLTRVLRHDDLEELTDRVQVVRYAPAAVVLIEAAAQARSWADRYFVSRKLPELVELAPEGSAMRHQLEVAADSLRERMFGQQE
jgi:hypothetical protein